MTLYYTSLRVGVRMRKLPQALWSDIKSSKYPTIKINWYTWEQARYAKKSSPAVQTAVFPYCFRNLGSIYIIKLLSESAASPAPP